jgi:hypothetical protein
LFYRLNVVHFDLLREQGLNEPCIRGQFARH